jgi:hypothetical protein
METRCHTSGRGKSGTLTAPTLSVFSSHAVLTWQTRVIGVNGRLLSASAWPPVSAAAPSSATARNLPLLLLTETSEATPTSAQRHASPLYPILMTIASVLSLAEHTEWPGGYSQCQDMVQSWPAGASKASLAVSKARPCDNQGRSERTCAADAERPTGSPPEHIRR